MSGVAGIKVNEDYKPVTAFGNGPQRLRQLVCYNEIPDPGPECLRDVDGSSLTLINAKYVTFNEKPRQSLVGCANVMNTDSFINDFPI